MFSSDCALTKIRELPQIIINFLNISNNSSDYSTFNKHEKL